MKFIFFWMYYIWLWKLKKIILRRYTTNYRMIILIVKMYYECSYVHTLQLNNLCEMNNKKSEMECLMKKKYEKNWHHCMTFAVVHSFNDEYWKFFIRFSLHFIFLLVLGWIFHSSLFYFFLFHDRSSFHKSSESSILFYKVLKKVLKKDPLHSSQRRD